MRSFSRREFLQDSARLAAALAGSATLGQNLWADEAVAKKKGDANDTLRVAVIGVRGRGKEHVQAFAGKHNCVVTTICDADEAVIGKVMQHVEKVQGKPPRFEQDLRRVMDDKSIDIITTATPNHWHALIAIWAMQSGKDVYVEKPVSHNVSEGRRIVETARKYKRMCQTGTQCRSSEGLQQAMHYLHSGELGKLHVARGLCYKPRGSIGKVSGPQPIPKTVNYDLWCGPAPMKPLMRKNLHYDWHWTWDYGNGDLGNQGIHEMDKARWGLGVSELPRSVISVGGRFGYVDDGQTANTQICVFDYGDRELIFEVRGLTTDALSGARVGNIFHCDKGILVMPNYNSAKAFTHDGKEICRFQAGGDHFGNFVKAVRSRKSSDLNADILEGHLSSALCHLGNVSYRLGTLQPFSKQTKAFGDDKEAYETLARMEEHLKDNKVPLDSTQYRVGRKLTVDPASESFVNDSEANTYLTREYRYGFEVPAKV
jgi:predicted dehydrogenase